MQYQLFNPPQPPAAVMLKTVPAVPVKSLKSFSPHAKKFYWDGSRFGVVSMGAILWFKYHKGKRLTGWVPDMKGEQPETYTEHLFNVANKFAG